MKINGCMKPLLSYGISSWSLIHMQADRTQCPITAVCVMLSYDVVKSAFVCFVFSIIENIFVWWLIHR